MSTPLPPSHRSQPASKCSSSIKLRGMNEGPQAEKQIDKSRQYFFGLFSHYLVYDTSEGLLHCDFRNSGLEIFPLCAIIHSMLVLASTAAYSLSLPVYFRGFYKGLL